MCVMLIVMNCTHHRHTHTQTVFFSGARLVISVLAENVLRLYSPDFCLYSRAPSVFYSQAEGPTAQPDDDDEKEDDYRSVVQPHRH